MPETHWGASEKAAELLPGAIVDRTWRDAPGGTPESQPPHDWVDGLWSLDTAVQAAIRGGWTDEEVVSEVTTLLRSHRATGHEGAPT